MKNIGQIARVFPLPKLIQKENFIGWVYSIGYDRAFVMTNDLWKAQALGIPHNCFLVATSFDPEKFNEAHESDQEVILLRVIGTAKLPQDDDLVRTKIDHLQDQTDIASQDNDYDDLTLSQIQFGGLECRVLGTFFIRDGNLWLGSDVESFATASRLCVYRPRGRALQTIVNYIDPIRKSAAQEEAQLLGIRGDIAPFQIGTVRYTSTDRLHRSDSAEHVPVCIQPADFLARRTAVLGMTRTGKSNMIKQTVSVVKRIADSGGIKVGQIIYDINGEYANANQIDKGALADIYPDTVRYRTVETDGFLDLRNNFYAQLNEGFSIIRWAMESSGKAGGADYVKAFLSLSFDEPDKQEEGTHDRWERMIAAYQVLLDQAGFNAPEGHRVRFRANVNVRNKVSAKLGRDIDPSKGISLEDAYDWFIAAREANKDAPLPSSTKGKGWIDDNLKTLLNMIAQKGDSDGFISGHRILADVKKYHTPKRSGDVAQEIYRWLVQGKIVILDLSVGDARIRENMSKRIAAAIFENSMQKFIAGKTPPSIVIYIEEAHNLIGKDADLIDVWPRMAKEGAKYRIGLVYATQEVSSMHQNILANTENWFITHLNNEREIRELARFYDFSDFGQSLIRAQDVGFARVKTLSSPFVIPVQIDKFNPQTARIMPVTKPKSQTDGMFPEL